MTNMLKAHIIFVLIVDGLPDKFGLAHVIVFQPLGKVGVFFLGHAGFDHMAAVGRVVFFLQALTSFLARQGA